MKTIIEIVSEILISALFAILQRISLHRGRRIGAFLGQLAWRLDRRHRRIAMKNLESAFHEMPFEKRNELTRRVFENLGQVFFEMAWSLGPEPKKLFSRFRIEGAEHMHRAYAEGKGVLALTAHYGNWELLTVIGKMIGYPLSIVYRPLDFKPLDRFVSRFRSRFGAELIPKKKTLRRILRSIHNCRMAALLMDQNVACRDGVFADFFGQPACTNKGLALLALKTGAPVVPVFLFRTKEGFTGRFLPQIPLIRTGDKIMDLEANTEQYNRVIEEMVRTRPEQWFWVHRRWNTKTFCPWPQRR